MIDLNIPKTIAYVGKISSTLDERWLMKLFKSCGSVNAWKPMIDPETKKAKGFGFVDFEKPEGVLCALRLLNKVEVDGSCLLVKVNTATQKYLNAFMRQKIKSESIVSISTMPIVKKIKMDKLNSILVFNSLQINGAINDCRVLKNIHQILKNRLIISKTMITEKSIMISGEEKIVNELRLDIKREKLLSINSSNNLNPNICEISKNDSQCMIEKKEQEIKIENYVYQIKNRDIFDKFTNKFPYILKQKNM